MQNFAKDKFSEMQEGGWSIVGIAMLLGCCVVCWAVLLCGSASV